MPKTSLWIEDAIAAGALLAFVAIGTPATLSLDKPERMPPAASEMPLLLPLDCDAWITQSGYGIDEPRARCYVHPEKRK